MINLIFKNAQKLYYLSDNFFSFCHSTGGTCKYLQYNESPMKVVNIIHATKIMKLNFVAGNKSLAGIRSVYQAGII